MSTVRRTLVRLALVVVFTPAVGCTFGAFPREARDPTLAALPPCFTGDVCGPFDAARIWWAAPTLQTAIGR